MADREDNFLLAWILTLPDVTDDVAQAKPEEPSQRDESEQGNESAD
jgi:hypothetical protein